MFGKWGLNSGRVCAEERRELADESGAPLDEQSSIFAACPFPGKWEQM